MLNYEGERVLSLENFVAALDKVPPDVQIDFSGMCEPFLNPEAADMMVHTGQQRRTMVLYTTLVGLRERDVMMLRDLEFREIVVHVPGGTTFVYDEQRWLDLNELFRKGTRLTPTYYVSVGQPNLRIRERLLNSYPEDRWIEDSMISRAGTNPLLPVTLREGGIRCSYASLRFDQNVLLPNGDVILCCMDYGRRHVLGNLFSQTYSEIYEGPIKNAVRQACLYGGLVICRHCERAVKL